MPGRFTLQLTPSFLRDLEALPRKEQERILKSLKRLESDPFDPAPQVKKLKAQGIGRWRFA